MATPVSQRELRNDSGAIMRRVQQGERFTVTRYGVPVADLVPHRESGPDRPPRFIPVAQIAAGTSEPPSWDTPRFTQELEELDNAVDDSPADRGPQQRGGTRSALGADGRPDRVDRASRPSPIGGRQRGSGSPSYGLAPGITLRHRENGDYRERGIFDPCIFSSVDGQAAWWGE